MAAVIRKVDLTDVEDVIKNSYLTPMELTDYSDGLIDTVKLASGRAEEFGGSIYVIEGGDLQGFDPGASNTTVYFYITDTGTPSHTLSNTAPTFDPNLGGWYSLGRKALFQMTKTGGNTYINKRRLYNPHYARFQEMSITNDLTINNDLTVDNDMTVTNDATITNDLNANGDLYLNSSTNGFLGTTAALDLTPYDGGSWVSRKTPGLYRMGDLVMVSFSTNWAPGTAIGGNLYLAIPAAWRPANNQYISGTAAGLPALITITTGGAITHGNAATGPQDAAGAGFYSLTN